MRSLVWVIFPSILVYLTIASDTQISVGSSTAVDERQMLLRARQEWFEGMARSCGVVAAIYLVFWMIVVYGIIRYIIDNNTRSPWSPGNPTR
jgi:hypothetical protein